MTRRTLVIAVFVCVACGDGDSVPPGTAASQGTAATSPMTVADSIAFAKEDSAMFEERKKSMGSYQSCIAGADLLENAEIKRQIMEACSRRPDAPKAKR